METAFSISRNPGWGTSIPREKAPAATPGRFSAASIFSVRPGRKAHVRRVEKEASLCLRPGRRRSSGGPRPLGAVIVLTPVWRIALRVLLFGSPSEMMISGGGSIPGFLQAGDGAVDDQAFIEYRNDDWKATGSSSEILRNIAGSCHAAAGNHVYPFFSPKGPRSTLGDMTHRCFDLRFMNFSHRFHHPVFMDRCGDLDRKGADALHR